MHSRLREAAHSGVVQFPSQQGLLLLVNVYPYFAYASEPGNICLDYAQFTATQALVTNANLNCLMPWLMHTLQPWEKRKTSAMKKKKKRVRDVDAVVLLSETGWPSWEWQFYNSELARNL